MRPDGRFEAKGINPLTGKRKSYYSRISQADAELRARRSYGIQIGKSVDSYFLGGFIPAIVDRSENWRIQVAWAMKHIWSPAIGEQDIDAVGRPDIQAAVNNANRRYAPKSVQNAFKVIHALFELAEADGLIDRNPCFKIRLAPLGKSTRKALDFHQLATLIKHSQPLAKPFVLLAGCASARLGEGVGARVADIDAQGVLKIERQIQQLKGRVVISDTLKTPQSYRSIPLPEGLRSMILESRAADGLWLCSDTKGGFIKPKNVRREVGIACERAGLGHYEERPDKEGKTKKVFIPLIGPHELRHTFISLMENDLEVPRRVVEMLSGKAAIGKTGRYSHAEMKQMEKAMSRFWDRVSTELTTDLTTHLRVSGL